VQPSVMHPRGPFRRLAGRAARMFSHGRCRSGVVSGADATAGDTCGGPVCGECDDEGAGASSRGLRGLAVSAECGAWRLAAAADRYLLGLAASVNCAAWGLAAAAVGAVGLAAAVDCGACGLAAGRAVGAWELAAGAAGVGDWYPDWASGLGGGDCRSSNAAGLKGSRTCPAGKGGGSSYASKMVAAAGRAALVSSPRGRAHRRCKCCRSCTQVVMMRSCTDKSRRMRSRHSTSSMSRGS
jgi:hypothetical protein